MMRRGLPLVVLLLSVGCATAITPRANSREEIVSYVTQAAQLVASEGLDACSTLSSPRWYSGGWYVFVFEMDGPVVCHPFQPSRVGTMENDVVDSNGKRIGDAFMQAVKTPQRSGWVDYVWPRPGSDVPVAKSSYVVRVTAPDGKDYVVGAGGYQVQ
ncbi:MAG TPA: cache domain-containing protein [Thermoanaerobaculia bacterium]|nr:cache domain-containing protein [Thermoanaerobaculia bacterium]